MRQSARIGLVLITAVLAVVILQWFAPEATVLSVTDRYLCDGVAEIDGQAAARLGVLHPVQCRRGAATEDMTALAMLALFVPCAVVVGTTALVCRRLFVSRGRTRGRLRPVHS